MHKSFYTDLARDGRRLPIITHMVLHEKEDPEAILLDGERLAAVMLEAAERFDNPMALPVMDLTLEKDILLQTMGVPAEQTAAFHFDAAPDAAQCRKITAEVDVLAHPRIKANCQALSILRDGGKVVPVGMSIGPFSLLTKLVKDPITAIYTAGAGAGPEDDDDVAAIYAILHSGGDHRPGELRRPDQSRRARHLLVRAGGQPGLLFTEANPQGIEGLR